MSTQGRTVAGVELGEAIPVRKRPGDSPDFEYVDGEWKVVADA